MKRKFKPCRKWLEANARAVAQELKLRCHDTPMRVRLPKGSAKTTTDGWSAAIGDLGKNGPRLEIWLDRFSGHTGRKLYACFRSSDKPAIARLTKNSIRELWPVRTISDKDTGDGSFVALAERLPASQFNAPIYERYRKAPSYFGIYDPTRATTGGISRAFCSSAVSFIEDVTRALPQSKALDPQREVYPKVENRKTVALHLRRERSRYLADQCKKRDNYKCQVCGLVFVKRYGSLGRDFAEAHHCVPLNKLTKIVETQLKDLVTVCANCHRMLHRMDGEKGDVAKLRRIVRKARHTVRKAKS
ncbi:MAG: HNH endonuclease [Planctomycetes bacterium]|nr:HNH endonuclease [Planctomycetota bacterium]